MPDTYHLIAYVGGGTLGFLLVGLVFLPLDPGVALGLILFSSIYFVGGLLGYWLWNRLSPD